MRIFILIFTLLFSVNYAVAGYEEDYVIWAEAQDVADAAVTTANEDEENFIAVKTALQNVDPYDEALRYFLQEEFVTAKNAATASKQMAVDLQDAADVLGLFDWLGYAQEKFEADEVLTDDEYNLVYDSAYADYSNGIPLTAREEQLLIDVYIEENKGDIEAQAQGEGEDALAAAEAAAAAKDEDDAAIAAAEAAATGQGGDYRDTRTAAEDARAAEEAKAAEDEDTRDDFVQLAGTVAVTMGAAAAGNMIDSSAVAGNASLDQLLSMNTRDDYSVTDHIKQTFDLGCAGFNKINFIKGVCTWLECKLLYCTINVSAIVEHKVPDLLVEVEGTEKESVIVGMNWFGDTVEEVGILLHKLVGIDINAIKGSPRGSQNSDKGGEQRDNYNEFDVTVMGNPYLYLYEYAMGTLMEATNLLSYCYSKAIPFQPYFTTKTSPEWRIGILERLYSVGDTVSGAWGDDRNINNYGYHFNPEDPTASLDAALGVYWGYLYPRMGMHKHKSIYRSASLMAQRASSIISYNNGDNAFPNLHIPTVFSWPPHETKTKKSYGVYRVKEHNDKHAWQLNYPQGKRSDGCYRFPDVEWDGADYINGIFPQKKIGEETVQTGTKTEYETVKWKTKSWTGHVRHHSKIVETDVPVYEQQDITEDITSNTQDAFMVDVDMPSDSNSYVWTLWRTYKCCTKRGQIFLFDFEW